MENGSGEQKLLVIGDNEGNTSAWNFDMKNKI